MTLIFRVQYKPQIRKQLNRCLKLYCNFLWCYLAQKSHLYIHLFWYSVHWRGTLPNFSPRQRESNKTSDCFAEQAHVELSWQVTQSQVIPEWRNGEVDWNILVTNFLSQISQVKLHGAVQSFISCQGMSFWTPWEEYFDVDRSANYCFFQGN